MKQKMKLSPTEIFESYKKLLFSTKIFSKEFIFVFLLFFLFTGMGVFIAKSNPEWTEEFVTTVAESFIELAQKNNMAIWFYIFSHNLFISITLIAFFFFLGVVPILALSLNGLTIGIIIAHSASRLNISDVFLAIIPHGLFEIPAFLIAAALSLYLSRKFLFLFGKKKHKFKKDFFFAIKIALFVITPLLLLASIIETFITPLLLAI